VLAPASPRLASAQGYPVRPVSVIEPFGVSSVPDIMIRILAPRVSGLIGQPVVVENVVGAGGQIGASRVARGVPDGYHLLIGTVSSQAFSQTLFKAPLYNAATDFAPVIMLTEQPLMLVTGEDLPARNLQEFIAYTRKNQSKMKYGAMAGTGSANHIMCALLNGAIGVEVTQVPYRPPSAIAYQDLISGRIDYVCPVATGDAKAHIEGGHFYGIAVFSRQRSPLLPEVATAQEQGLADLEGMQWSAIFAPKGTPAAIVQRLHDAFNDALETPEVRARMESYGAQVVGSERRSPKYLQEFVESEIRKWAAPIRASGAAGQ
jgi:tripartite-type tricarboxylate transporter receptor subunit TctC